MNYFAERLRFLRTNKKAMQQTLADSMDISLRQYQRYEKGEQAPDFGGLLYLSDFFNVPTDLLLGNGLYRHYEFIRENIDYFSEALKQFSFDGVPSAFASFPSLDFNMQIQILALLIEDIVIDGASLTIKWRFS